ncbi:hypothetical protein C8F04DRAFT_1258183 [Mycena alexandri]|uniref:Uncharacterized protein n=1 Tax=Mycena alexandri TaxID=1745969 RepID=A0AAD6SZG4_9AGAR|nr:hypothetical protein C8F04DRAFT_1258183 [Mycena alexandri]
MSSPICRIFWIPELSDAVLDLCSLEDLVHFSHSGPFGREVFSSFFALKFRLTLTRFIAPTHIDNFITQLDGSGAAIVGTFSALLVCSAFGNQKHSTARDLNIASPSGTIRSWTALMVRMGGREFAAEMDERPRTRGAFVTITVSECMSSSVLPTVLRAADTSQMTMINAHRIVVPYQITLHGFYATGMHVPDSDDYLSAAFRRFKPEESRGNVWILELS